MCYICTCFSYTLDLIQSIITFGLACLFTCAVCFAFVIAVGTGIAYGYNYSMAEFLNFTRRDVTVYVKPGHDIIRNPNILIKRRKLGRDEKEEVAEYENLVIAQDNALRKNWIDKLTKTGPDDFIPSSSQDSTHPTPNPVHHNDNALIFSMGSMRPSRTSTSELKTVRPLQDTNQKDTDQEIAEDLFRPTIDPSQILEPFRPTKANGQSQMFSTWKTNVLGINDDSIKDYGGSHHYNLPKKSDYLNEDHSEYYDMLPV